ncbi:hypothetical protein I3842_06G102300 [Carya illinoinensis]|uniref:Uncharacterized protein n=1 Tax=Carya illinoinensis TaxID=32201 RepID=A0A922EUB1_CARIL|nr:hypothetical protein I3842_06G102300 [Carya illinoinensis]
MALPQFIPTTSLKGKTHPSEIRSQDAYSSNIIGTVFAPRSEDECKSIVHVLPIVPPWPNCTACHILPMRSEDLEFKCQTVPLNDQPGMHCSGVCRLCSHVCRRRFEVGFCTIFEKENL